jgi:hypothetical protein
MKRTEGGMLEENKASGKHKRRIREAKALSHSFTPVAFRLDFACHA